MSANEPLTLALVREFILKNGSRVRNHDLITHFRTQLNDPVNKGKVRADFKEYVHQLTTVQTIDGEKYFVLKKPKEAPAVLRKPPTRPHTTHHKPRPVSAMPVARHAKMFEEMAAARYPMTRSHSEDHAMNELPDKENRPRELKALSDIVKSGSIDSMDSVGSTHSTPKMGRKISQPGKRQGDSLERNSQALSEDVFEDPDIDGDDLMNIPTIQLDAIEKEWLLTTARGNRAHIMCLLEQEPLLAKRKDFTSTALHWAAKHGRDDVAMMVAKAGADVNSKTGYTPLHLAAMHGNDRVIKVLVDDFKADINARDFSGRKPRQVAKDTLTIEAQRRLEHVLTLSDSSSESGYSSQGQQTPKYGSLNSIVTPSAALMGYYGGGPSEAPLSVAQPPAESGDKHRDRTSSLGKFLHKKKKSKDHRQPMPSTPYPSNSSAGPPSSPYQSRSTTSLGGHHIEATVVRDTFRRLDGTSLAGGSRQIRGLLIGSPIELQRMDEERRENELDMKRTQSDPNLLHDEV